jgi:hypothetical protein
LKARGGINGDAVDRLRVSLGDFLDLHPAGRGAHEHRPAGRGIDENREIELTLDGSLLFDQDAADVATLGPSLGCYERHTDDLLRGRLDLLRRGAGLDAAALAAPAGVDLRFDDSRSAQFAGHLTRLSSRRGDSAARDRNAVAGEQRLGLVLVDFHRVSLERSESVTGRRRV